MWDDGTVKTPKVVMRVSHDGGASFASRRSSARKVARRRSRCSASRNEELTIAWSELSEAQHDHAKETAPNMKDPKAVKGLVSRR